MKKILFSTMILSSLLLVASDDFPPQIPTSGATQTEGTTDDGVSKTSIVKIGIRVGWNLVGLPGYSAYTVEDLFAPQTVEGMAIVSGIESVFAFDVEAGSWKTYVPGNRDNSLTKLTPGQGFWIKAKYNGGYGFNSGVSISGKESAEFTDGSNIGTLPPIFFGSR